MIIGPACVYQESSSWRNSGIVIINENSTIEVNGLRLHYIKWQSVRSRSGNRPTGVLLNGSSGNARVWDLFAPAEALAGFIQSNLIATRAGDTSPPSLTYRFDRATLAQFESYDE